ncbi:Synaptic vesicle membrane protein VAT-1 -like protein-like [Takifugu flavidus]|uniref:Synaptic vesicle membrane protein VAT-1-like protein-like n=2 Tax=Takifugu flavidus TaxID=433684 RepID=A0A5C6NLY5_9TELE|nr:Synaptic vesicle membrane protein VAT-1 -like protein-like [Takifugu flavidus]
MRILTINSRHIRTMFAFRRCATSTAVTALRALRSNQVTVSAHTQKCMSTQTDGEVRITKILKEKFPLAASLKVVDISGGCGAMYEVHIESMEFKGKRTIQQHQLVNQAAHQSEPRGRGGGEAKQQVSDMAKEGADMTEETECMIDRNAGKEAENLDSPRDAKEMRAVLLTAFGGLNKLRMTRKAMPELQDGEVKIRVKACGLNFLDLMVRQGTIDNPPKPPVVPGFECSGIVEAVGENAEGFEIGDRVMAFVNCNAWAEVVCTPAEFVYKMPDEMTFAEAAAFSMNFVAAYMMLFEVANLREGMSVLVHSAGGGVGQAVAQLCSTVPNVAVFGIASCFKHTAIRGSVTHLFDRNVDYMQEVKKISPEGVDVVLDCLCGENTGKGLNLLKPLGTYILYGASNMVTGETKSFFSFAKSWWQVEKVNPIKLYEENKVIAGFSLLNLLFRHRKCSLVRSVMDKLLCLYGQKKIRPVVDSLWALEEVKEAMQRIHDRGNIGKLILDVEKAPTPLMASDSTETSEAGEEEEEPEGDNESKERIPFIH